MSVHVNFYTWKNSNEIVFHKQAKEMEEWCCGRSVTWHSIVAGTDSSLIIGARLLDEDAVIFKLKFGV